ncbi:oligopeptide/dipeptide ABC transporter, ATP-binding protein, C-terminal domain-containing protein [Proteiniborus ethanoligenes]|uniref:Oligopeptide/dipeptide ABC transporter, ATP-binding protein, C-terminal domain-containing protein n=1 Tax=Proteiniborus ethanoligenes TaxID=415015 RepID=A0A1H3Q5E6_9FIRM|nr:oligopeptide/dipeptide ABC transporter ATP-binding protein [Proteiniborus ethanoligenes]SDZ08596.1 oligopeptide/dipeptide ABC transporter, ATP-binding protein, C-terminal domain-containing protein [Proteiniborus ethanoligenes]
MEKILEVKNLKKYFKTPKGMLHAVDGVDLWINRGQTLGIVGESGCGKSTMGRVVLKLLPATDGNILFEGKDIGEVKGQRLRELRKKMQIIFQDPFSSLNPRMSVSEIIGEPLIIHKAIKGRVELEKKVAELMGIVGLADRLINTYPHELDGGRRQRIGIARALALNPSFIVCDEPVSALDVSIQAQILNLMQDLQKELGLTYMFITHDLSVVKHISDDIGVMYVGKMVEKAPSKKLFQMPYHPYTKALLSAIPVPSLKHKRKVVLLKGEIASPISPKPGCRFAARCPYAGDKCHVEEPQLEQIAPEHLVACHYVRAINGI